MSDVPVVSFDVEPYLSGKRVDTVLSTHLRTYSPWRMHRLVCAGQVQVNGEVVPPVRRLYPGQRVTVRLIEPPDDLFPAEPVPFSIAFEDEWIMVVNKPAGLIVHPTGMKPRGTLANAIQHYLDRANRWKGLQKPGFVHRLDRDTSGLVAVAKEHVSHRELSICFQNERISKSYLALVDGVIANDEGVIDRAIGRARKGASALMSCFADAVDARASRTLYKVIERLPKHTVVKAMPRTGRLHQIRVHLSSIGHPIVGDEYYGPFGELRPARKPPLPDGSPSEPPISPLIPRQALHAAELAFTHPITSQWVEFRSSLPSDMLAAIELVRQL